MSMSREQKEQLKQHYLTGIPAIGREEAQEAYSKGRSKLEDLKDDIPGKLKEMWADIMSMMAMLGDYLAGNYTDVPWKTIAAIAGAILYFVFPFDFIPDFIPIIGYLDDAFVIALAVDLIRDDLLDYRLWQAKTNAG
jgi:uncharacterized membrane protein YkvA (DUF1232 family)